ncbi:hypothetical protein HG66A1_54540 [Gimesia chilikensis]|uniref:DUF1257 domain-containing protein n=2 Tax=Gimesia chilikensis TaxID=2605989 RepID=A0A517PW80_9PLAN|nr:hypothetical protein HG66A1_54540 [Gimesia chilikensis]
MIKILPGFTLPKLFKSAFEYGLHTHVFYIVQSRHKGESNTMSHIVQIQTEVRDPVAVSSACSRLSLPAPTQRTVRLFNGEVSGLAVELPGWRYPVVCQLASGQLQYDNYEGRWGDQAHLNKFVQIYCVEKAKLEARKAGHCINERTLQDGSILIQVQVNS